MDMNQRPPTVSLWHWLPGWSALAVWAGLLLLFLAAIGTMLATVWYYWYADRIYPGVYISGIPMSGKTRSEALAQLQEQGLQVSQQPLRILYEDKSWVLRSDLPDSSHHMSGLIDQAYQMGRNGTWLENLQSQVKAVGSGVHFEARAVYRAEEIDQVVSKIMQDVGTVPANLEAKRLFAIPNPSDRRVNASLLVAQIDQAIRDKQDIPIRLKVEELPNSRVWLDPTLVLREPLLLSHPQSTNRVALDPQMISAAILQQDPLVLNEDVLATWVRIWQPLFERAPSDAKIRFDEDAGGLYVHEPSRMGIALDVESTVTAIVDALHQGLSETRLHLEFSKPGFQGQNLDQFGIRELVGRGTSYFLGSSAARVHNIELTTAQFEGILIPPDAIFSFNEHIGPITTAAGFTESAIIWGDRTAVGVGGGVCQVSTTIFRAAFTSGLPIVERYNHGYVVSWYGQPGLDATIYSPFVDFKFRNDTSAYLLLQPDLDSEKGTLTVNLYGTKPDRTVTISDPVISQVVDPPEPVYLQDSSLAPGKQRLVESEKLGVTVAVERHIEEGGKLHTETLHSVYRPWRAVYLVGSEQQQDGIDNLEQSGTG